MRNTPHTACIQTHSPPVLHYPYARHPSHCHLVTAPSAHHTTPHHTTPYHATPHRTAPDYAMPYHSTPCHTIPYPWNTAKHEQCELQGMSNGPVRATTTTEGAGSVYLDAPAVASEFMPPPPPPCLCANKSIAHSQASQSSGMSLHLLHDSFQPGLVTPTGFLAHEGTAKMPGAFLPFGVPLLGIAWGVWALVWA